MFMTVLVSVGGVFLMALLGFVIWVAAFRRDYYTWSTGDAPQLLRKGDAEARGDYIGGSGRAPGDYVGSGPYW